MKRGDPRQRLDALGNAARAHVRAGKTEALAAWILTLSDPADRAAVHLGAALAFDGVDPRQVLHLDIMLGVQ